MNTGFLIGGMALGAFTGFKTGFGGWVLAGFIGLLVEFIVSIAVINVASSSGHPWATGIGGFILGSAVGSLTSFVFKH